MSKLNTTIEMLTTISHNFDEKLQLFYQLQYDMATNLPISAEALSRLAGDNPVNEAPSQLISQAERDGSSVIMTYWAVNRALTDFRDLQYSHGIRHIAVNISPSDLIRKDLVKNIELLLKVNSLSGHCLELEITEKLPISNLRNTVANIQALKSINVNVVLDDFGSGYTSLPALIHMPVKGIKLDKMFCDNIDDIKYRSIAESLVYLTNKLGMSVLLEGVEHTQHHNVSRKMGFTYAQGYHFHKPQSKRDLINHTLRSPSRLLSISKQIFNGHRD